MPVSRISVYLFTLAVLVALPVAATMPYGDLPLTFEKNEGQFEEPVRFLSRSAGYTVFLTRNEMVLRLNRARGERDVVRWQWKGANLDAPLAGEALLETRSNYLRGDDPVRWRTGIANYARVRQTGVYPGIDVVYRGNQRRLEYDFELAPGADAGRIRIVLQGPKSMKLGANGDLVLRIANGDLVQPPPEVYQETNGRRTRVEGRYVVVGKNEIGFALGAYDRTRPLIIDPVVHYATYLGGTGFDEGLAIAVDSSGNAYVTGLVDSATFTGVTGSSIQSSPGGDYDIFVTKINAAGSAIVYSTFLGGTGGNEYGMAIAADSSGNAYVAGATSSSGFPGVTGSSIQSTYGGGTRDAFLTKINSGGTAITYSTYLGGSGDDVAGAVEVDASGNVYLHGSTASSNFPVTTGVAQTSLAGSNDTWVAKVNSAGSALTWSTYLGGTGNDLGSALAVDSSGSVHVTGSTTSTSFPGVSGSSLQSANGGGDDAYVTKLNSSGTAVTWSTFLGGSSTDGGASIDVDGSGDVYVGGNTQSSSFPGVTGGSLQSSLNGTYDGFVTKIDSAGTSFGYSTYLGGSGIDLTESVRVDSSGNVYVGSVTTSTDYPGVTGTSMQPSYGGGTADCAVVKLSSSATSFVYSTYYGGSGDDQLFGMDTDANGNVYLTGWSDAAIPDASNSAIQSTVAGDYDAFVAKIGEPGMPAVTSISPTSARNGDQITINGYNFDNQQGAGGQVWLGSKNAGSIVSWSNKQIVATVASGSISGSAQVKQGGVWSNSIALTVLTPVITNVTPTTGRASDQITITGSYFGNSGTTSQVWLGNRIAGGIVSWSDTEVVATIASGASSGTVQIAAGGVWYNYGSFTVITPNISSISPTTAYSGDSITITGTGFGTTQGSGNVWLGDKYTGSVMSWSDTQIVATVANGAKSGSAQVLQNGVWSNTSPLTVITPAISGITPTSGPAGTQVTITGTGFRATQGSGLVWIGTQYATVVSWSDTQVVATVASGSATGGTQVLQGGVWSNAVTFTVTP